MADAAMSAPRVAGLNCPNCGAAIVLHGMAWTQVVACPSCASVLDARDPNLAVLQRHERKLRVQPLIPLGTDGEWRGARYRAIGFQQRTITVDGIAYSWREYLLFNPYRGFRYLTEYDGHWNDVVGIPSLPKEQQRGGRPSVEWDGRHYAHFQTARAETTFVLGEFPWEVRTGDTVTAKDFVDPPHMLSAESTEDETTWSRGEYVDGALVWKAFRLDGAPPRRRGVFANQPSPYKARAGSYWRAFAVLAAVAMAAMIVRLAVARNATVFEANYRHTPGDSAAAFVTPTFELPGARANVVIQTSTDLQDRWLYMQYALIDEASGRAYDVGREVSFYSGRDSDGSWTEGSKRDRVRFGPVPGGRYFLRVEPAADPSSPRAISYQVSVRRDVPSPLRYLLVLLALLVPPVVALIRQAAFEATRWAESDYAPSGDDGGDDDE